MERRIYLVEFEVKTSDTDDWFPESRTVLANGDALKVVEKAKRHALKDFAKPYTDDDTGKRVTPKVQGWRLTAVKVIAEADVV